MAKKSKKEFQDQIIKDYPRLQLKDSFKFSCNPGVSCFNKCCNDVNIFLTPYDIIRLKNRLGINSTEFLKKYTIIPLDEHLKYPVIMFRMDDESFNCKLVSDKGCTVYEDRPWACRMFPIGMASPDELKEETEEEFFFLLQEDVCKGFEEADQEWTVEKWLEDQGVKEYNEFGEIFKEITLNPYFQSNKGIEPIKLEMFYTVCYDIDKFRELVFNSTFFQRFDVGSDKEELMKTDDVELLRFGFNFLRFSLFGEKTLKLKQEYEESILKTKN